MKSLAKQILNILGILMLLTFFNHVITDAGAATNSPTQATSSSMDSALERPTIVLGQGEQRLLRISSGKISKYSLGFPGVHAHILTQHKANANKGEQILLKGVSPGTGDLWIWKQDGSSEFRTIRVEKLLSRTLKPALEHALGQLQEAEIIYSGSGVILRGELTSMNETAKVAALTRGFPNDIPNNIYDETEISETLLFAGLNRIRRWIQDSPYYEKLRVEKIGKELWLRGSISRPAERAAAEKATAVLFPLIKFEIETMPDTAPTIHFKVFLLELKKNRLGSFGLSWPAVQEGVFRVTTGGIQDLLQLDLTLQSLEGEGSLKILSNPELVVRAPGEAELFSGGELPIHMESHFYSNVVWKTYGLTLKLKVTHTTGEQVRLDISTEVSHLDPSIAMDKIPGIQSNRMKTQVDARYGVPLLLSGLLQQSNRDNARGLPFLRNIPVLGALFGSEDYIHERSELVAILLPSTAPPPTSMERIEALTPKGPAPAPRNWVDPKQEKELQASSDYPWNAFK